MVKTSCGHGESRTVGPAPEIVAMAQDELQQIYQPTEMNEKIFQGKVLEIKGRSLVMSRGQGSLQVHIRADQPRGRDLLGETTSRTMPTAAYAPRTPSTRTPPSAPTPTRSRSTSPSPSFAPSPAPKALAKAKARAATVPPGAAMPPPGEEIEDVMVIPENNGVEITEG